MLEFYVKFMIAMGEKRDEKGATGVEYGLLVALIAAVIVGLVYTLGTEVKAGFQTVVTELQKP